MPAAAGRRRRSSGSRRRRKRAQLAEQHLQAEEKRLAVGLSDTFRVFQAQRDLTDQLNSELNAIIDYNRALINFEAVQTVPLGGGSSEFEVELRLAVCQHAGVRAPLELAAWSLDAVGATLPV